MRRRGCRGGSGGDEKTSAGEASQQKQAAEIECRFTSICPVVRRGAAPLAGGELLCSCPVANDVVGLKRQGAAPLPIALRSSVPLWGLLFPVLSGDLARFSAPPAPSTTADGQARPRQARPISELPRPEHHIPRFRRSTRACCGLLRGNGQPCLYLLVLPSAVPRIRPWSRQWLAVPPKPHWRSFDCS